MKWNELAITASKVVLEYDLIDPEETIIGVEQDGLLEHLVHEVSHAVSLDLLPFDPSCTHKRIGIMLTNTSDHGIENETVTFAIEWFALQHLGAPFDLRDILDAAEMQGCEVEGVLAMIQSDHPEADAIYENAMKAVAEVRRLATQAS